MGKVQVAVVVGQDHVGLGHDADAPAALVDHGDPGELVVPHDADDLLDGGVRGHRLRVAVHDLSDSARHGG
jgi:hypothetical protein